MVCNPRRPKKWPVGVPTSLAFSALSTFIVGSQERQYIRASNTPPPPFKNIPRTLFLGSFPLPLGLLSFLPSFLPIRLGTFLFARIRKDGHDSRFNGVRDRPLKFLLFWCVQASFFWARRGPLSAVSPGQAAAAVPKPLLRCVAPSCSSFCSFLWYFDADRPLTPAPPSLAGHHLSRSDGCCVIVGNPAGMLGVFHPAANARSSQDRSER